MPPIPEFMRPMRLAEVALVDGLLRAAFAGDEEAALVTRLRTEGLMEVEMVLPGEGEVIGYLALSRLMAPEGWLVLAPVAIAPPWQRRGLGARLVAKTMQLMAIKGKTTVVLGEPGFYGRCGFSSARAAALTSPFPIAHTLLARPGDDIPTEALRYPAAFDGV
jgi:putative acetyltransferase